MLKEERFKHILTVIRKKGKVDYESCWAACIADLYLMGTWAVQKDFGISAVFEADGQVKRSMLKNAVKTFALGNKATLNSIAHFKVCEFKEISGLITELRTDDRQLDDFRNLGLRLM
jgi:DeoR/GlpR family transcriptional regulator of sugar metabolism